MDNILEKAKMTDEEILATEGDFYDLTELRPIADAATLKTAKVLLEELRPLVEAIELYQVAIEGLATGIKHAAMSGRHIDAWNRGDIAAGSVLATYRALEAQVAGDETNISKTQ